MISFYIKTQIAMQGEARIKKNDAAYAQYVRRDFLLSNEVLQRNMSF